MKNTMLNLAACAAICATSACTSFADCGASQWKKARVAFLGDPMTAADTATATNTYCKMLGDDLELDWESFGADGALFIDILKQSEKADKRFGGEIDAISGATISSRAVLSAVNAATERLQTYLASGGNAQ